MTQDQFSDKSNHQVDSSPGMYQSEVYWHKTDNQNQYEYRTSPWSKAALVRISYRYGVMPAR